MGKLLWLIYALPLREVIWICCIAIIAWALIGSRADRKWWWKAANGAVFLIIVAVILHTTLFSRQESARQAVMIPLGSLLAAREQPEVYRSMLMNSFLFLPLGLSLPYLTPEKWSATARAVCAVLAGCCLSAVVEALQYWYGLGRCEVDDVIMNTLGALAGAQACVLGNKFKGN